MEQVEDTVVLLQGVYDDIAGLDDTARGPRTAGRGADVVNAGKQEPDPSWMPDEVNDWWTALSPEYAALLQRQKDIHALSAMFNEKSTTATGRSLLVLDNSGDHLRAAVGSGDVDSAAHVQVPPRGWAMSARRRTASRTSSTGISFSAHWARRRMPRGLSTRLVTAARIPTPSTSTTTSWAPTDCIQLPHSVDMFWSRTICSSI